MIPKKFLIGDRFAVFAFHAWTGAVEAGSIDAGDRTPILIGPGKAFGSGEHETTASVLEEMEKMAPLDGKRVLDLGSGTGILAIAAVKLGAGEVVAIDPEDGAYEAAVRNLSLNGVKDRIKVVKGDITAVPVDSPRFDLVLANLYGDLLLGLAPRMPTLLEKCGRLILSGMTYDFSSDVKTAFGKAGFVVERSRALENFCTFVLKPV